MNNFKRPIIVYVFLVIIAGCSTNFQQPAVEPIAPNFDELIEPYLEHPSLGPATVGIVIQNPDSREILFQRNPHRLFIPASNQKLITTAAALDELGPDFRFHTQVYANGQVADGTLQGDLYIRGSGDPTLSGRFHDGETMRDLLNWVDSLRAAGINEIAGDIFADANLFDDQRLGNGWEYSDLSYWYAAEISALSFNDNCLNLTLIPGDSIGAPARVIYEPETDYVNITNELRTVHSDSVTRYDYHRIPETNQIRLFGNISMSERAISDWVTIGNPALFTATVFLELLEENGIQVSGAPREIHYEQGEIPDYSDMEQLVNYASPPLDEIVRVINKRSQNFYAEQVLKRLGYEVNGQGSFDVGISAVKDFLAGAGVNTEQMQIADGSGLSRRNLVTPFQLVSVLRYMYESPNRDIYLSSLPVGGEDGSLRSRMLSPLAANRIHAKTGYVGFVRTLSGYVRTMDNRLLIFSILVNNYTTDTSILTLITSRTYSDLFEDTR